MLALVGALLAWVVVSGLAYLLIRGQVHALGEKQYLPEIPTSEAAVLVNELIRRRFTIATAESCSGGIVAALLCSVPDTSKVFRADPAGLRRVSGASAVLVEVGPPGGHTPGVLGEEGSRAVPVYAGGQTQSVSSLMLYAWLRRSPG